MALNKGFEETTIRLKGLSQVTAHSIVGSAIYKSAKPMEDEAKKLIRSNIKDKVKSTGNLERSISRVRTPLKKANSIGEVRVGPRVGAKASDTSAGAASRRGYHANLVEFGTKNRPPGGWYRSFPNAHPTSSKPSPFLAPAYLRTNDLVVSNIKKNMALVIRRYVKTGKLQQA